MAPGPACGTDLSRTHRIAGVRCLLVSGYNHGNPVTDGALLVGALGVEILLLAMLLPRACRCPGLPHWPGFSTWWPRSLPSPGCVWSRTVIRMTISSPSLS